MSYFKNETENTISDFFLINAEILHFINRAKYNIAIEPKTKLFLNPVFNLLIADITA